jgi:hypothetical protein
MGFDLSLEWEGDDEKYVTEWGEPICCCQPDF